MCSSWHSPDFIEPIRSCGCATQTSCRCLGHPILYGPKRQRGEVVERFFSAGITTLPTHFTRFARSGACHPVECQVVPPATWIVLSYRKACQEHALRKAASRPDFTMPFTRFARSGACHPVECQVVLTGSVSLMQRGRRDPARGYFFLRMAVLAVERALLNFSSLSPAFSLESVTILGQ